MKNSLYLFTIAFLLLAQITPTLHGMKPPITKEKGQETYLLTTVDGAEITVSKRVIVTSPLLSKLAKDNNTSSFTIDCINELLPAIGLIDNLIGMTQNERAVEIGKLLPTKQYAQLIEALHYLELRKLLDFSLGVYIQKFNNVAECQPVTSIPSLMDLTSKCIADNTSSFLLTTLKELPLELQEKILLKMNLSTCNFQSLIQWMQQLHAQRVASQAMVAPQAQKTARALLEFTNEQCTSLDTVANCIFDRVRKAKDLLKVFQGLSGPTGTGTIKLIFLRRLLHTDLCSLTKSKRFKLAWRVAFHEQSAELRDAIFDELALFQANNNKELQHRSSAHAFPKGIFYAWSEFGKGMDKESLMLLIKARYRFCYAMLKKGITLQNLAAMPSIDSEEVLKYLVPFSTQFVVSEIQQFRKKIACTPLKVMRTRFTYLLSLLSFTPERTQAALSEALRESPPYFNPIETYGHLVKYTQLPLPSNIDNNLKQSLNEQFCKKTAYILSDLDRKLEEQIQQVPRIPQIPGIINDNNTSVIWQEGHKAASSELMHLLIQGADLNAQNQDGDTIAHRAFLTQNPTLIDFLGKVTPTGLGKIDMLCKNKKGETPLKLLHQMRYSDDLCVIIKAGKQSFSPTQLAEKMSQFNLQLKRQAAGAHPAFLTTSRGILLNKLTGFEYALYWLNLPWSTALGCGATSWDLDGDHYSSSPSKLERVQLAWLFALKETNPVRINTLLTTLHSILFNKIPAEQIPQPLFRFVLKDLHLLIKQVQNGNLLRPHIINKLGAHDLMQLLLFSDCLWSYLAKLPPSAEQNQALLKTLDLNALCAAILQGADINCQDAKGNTILHYAISANKKQLVEMLLKVFKGRITMGTKNAQQCTPLILAAKQASQDQELVTTLFNHVPITELNILAEDDSGHSALDYLSENSFVKKQIYLKLIGEYDSAKNSDEADSDEEDSGNNTDED